MRRHPGSGLHHYGGATEPPGDGRNHGQALLQFVTIIAGQCLDDYEEVDVTAGSGFPAGLGRIPGSCSTAARALMPRIAHHALGAVAMTLTSHSTPQ